MEGENHGGGLALLWKRKNTTHLRFFSKKCIDVEIDIAERDPWRLTCFYGFPERSKRKESWQLLRWLKTRSEFQLQWCCLGDFNDLLAHSEKKGGSRYPSRLIQGFRDAVRYGGLKEVVMKGYPFTWEQSRGTPYCIEEKLDRALASEEWHHRFPTAYVANEDAAASDHSALILFLDQLASPKVSFRFENADEECRTLIEKCWNQPNLPKIQDRIHSCATELKLWSREKENMFRGQLTEYRNRIRMLKQVRDEASQSHLREARMELCGLLAKRKTILVCIRRPEYKVFPSFRLYQEKNNEISQLKDASGTWCRWDNGLQQLIVNHFKDIFTSRGSESGPILSTVHKKITDQQNQFLLRPFVGQEVKDAVFAMHPINLLNRMG